MANIKKFFVKEEAKKAPVLLVEGGRFHLNQDMKVGVNEQGPFYILKFDYVTDKNGLEVLLSGLSSDGSVMVNVLDGNETTDNKPESK